MDHTSPNQSEIAHTNRGILPLSGALLGFDEIEAPAPKTSNRNWQVFVWQPVVSLPFKHDDRHNQALSKDMNKSMHTSAFLQWPILFGAFGIMIGELAGVEIMRWYPTLTILFMPLVISCTWAMVELGRRLIALDLKAARNRLGKNQYTPDWLMLSGDGLQLGWMGALWRNYSWILRWSKIRLVYLERDQNTADDHYFICLRNNSGGVMRIPTSAFSSRQHLELFIDLLRQKVPDALTAAPLYFSIQPPHRVAVVYLWRWMKEYCLRRQQSDPQMRFLPGEHVLQGGRYKIVRREKSSAVRTRYIAEATTDLTGEKLYSTWDLEGLPRPFGAQLVTIDEYALPPTSLNFADYLEHLGALDHYVRQATSLDHKRIARWLDVFVEQSRGYVVWESLEGKTLAQLVEESGKLTSRQTVGLSLQMCEIISVMHQQGLVHNNLTPHSFIIDRDNHVRLAELPIMHKLNSKRLGGVIGCAPYMAPESAAGIIAKQNDLYSIGAIMSYLITGLQPETFKTSEPRHIEPSTTEMLNNVVRSATEQNPYRRLESIDILKRQLIACEAENLMTRLLS